MAVVVCEFLVASRGLATGIIRYETFFMMPISRDGY